jgi:hypothetical protein
MFLKKGAGSWKLLLLIPFFVFCGGKVETAVTETPPGQDSTMLSREKKFGKHFKWKENYDPSTSILYRISPPKGFKRVSDSGNVYGAWLRRLPLKPAGTAVKLYNGEEKGNQSVHVAVIDIDCGTKDLQQCADAVMRLRAEFLYGNEKAEQIRFNYTNGTTVPYAKWKQGFRPVVKGNKVSLVKTASTQDDYKSFKSYLWNIFNYAGSKSLSLEMKKVNVFSEIKAGDVLIVGGFPGHAMTVMDVAVNDKGKKVFLLSQSYMPAQDIHIVKNPGNSALSPWYELPADGVIETPEWTFKTEHLMKWE